MSDDDRQVIADLEKRILLSDPEFAARMADQPAGVRFPTVSVLCAILFILVPPVMLLFGWPGLIIVVDLFIAALVAVLLHRRQR
ncbi:DUF3040 domain-containing protein [Actinoplanes sp. G11-F43]|uniref:DUF3040 domain-containing protein n=1 Tax=Actinoplanes sp. G11-F43 TaxID=3424130 RepID=UPI003D347D25